MAEGQAKVFQLNAKSPTAFALAKHFPLQPQDVVFVARPTSPAGTASSASCRRPPASWAPAPLPSTTCLAKRATA